jgi:hypothetical protein
LNTKVAVVQSCSCSENWSCSPWSKCAKGQQERNCQDLNKCGLLNTKFPEVQSCAR